jgi:plasmid stabilization system protein ParE
MSRKVHLSQQARDDVEQAYLYIRQDAPERAKRRRERLLVAVQSLRDFPERPAVVFDAGQVGREVRQMTFGVYLVLYSVDAERLKRARCPARGPAAVESW